MLNGLTSALERKATASPDRLTRPTPQVDTTTRAAPRSGTQVRMAYLVSRYPAVSHTFILREVNFLRNQGFEIEVASVNPPDRTGAQMTDDERHETVRTYYLKRHGLAGAVAAHVSALRNPVRYLRGLLYALSLGGSDLRRILFGLFYFTEALMLGRWMATRRIRHLHVHFATAAANISLILKRSHGIGLSLTVHGPDEFYDAPGQQLGEKLEAADFVVCISRFARSQVMKLTPASHWHKFEVCPLGVDPQRYAPAERPAGTRPFTILCVGRLTPAKGQRVLVDAAARLAADETPFQLVIVGTGPDEADLQRAVKAQGLSGRVKFTGALNQQEVLDWYAQADAFVLPSFAEGVPVVLMEAMACGIPCLTTRITGIPELIRDGKDGLLVTPSDSDELASTLTRLMHDTVLRARLARDGRIRVREHYDLGRNVSRLGRVFQVRLGGEA
jgi:colanic acid/amylovoran biosynthesis glycosyltransferase